MADILYLCNGKADCSNDAGCFTQGGQCKYTRFIDQAVNFVKDESDKFFIELPNPPIPIMNLP